MLPSTMIMFGFISSVHAVALASGAGELKIRYAVVRGPCSQEKGS